MAAGIVVIGAATGGTPEIIANGYSGLLIPLFSAGAIAEAANRLLDDPQLRCHMAKHGEAVVGNQLNIRPQIGC